MLKTFLGQITDRRTTCQLQLAGINLRLAGQQTQQSGFTGTIFATKTDPVRRANMPVDMTQHDLVCKLFDNIL